MKKNYMILTMLSALVISGCGNDGTSSSNDNSASTSVYVTPKVKEAVSHISYNYSIYYSFFDTNNVEHEYKNFVETSKRADGKGDLAYYSEYNGWGYYVKADESEGYSIFTNGEGKTIYNSSCYLEKQDIDDLKVFLDLNGNFSNANWTLESESEKDNTVTYFTDDAKVIATASYLTDYLSETNPVTNVKATIKDRKLYGFTTYNTDGDVIIEAEVKRVGGSKAIENTPIKVDDDYIDPMFYTKWMAVYGYSHFGGYGAFEVSKKDNKVRSYLFDINTEKYSKLPYEYEFLGADGIGFYYFEDSATGNRLAMKINEGYVSFATYDKKTGETLSDYAYEYYSIWFQLAAEMGGLGVEEIASEDPLFEIMDIYEAPKGFVLCSYATNEDGEQYEENAVIMLQYLNKEEVLEKFFDGNTALYNAFSLNGYVYGNIVFSFYYMGEEDAPDQLLSLVAQIIPDHEFIEFDTSEYPEVKEGQSAMDYLIETMVGQGYSYVNKDTADPNFVINEQQVPVVDEETGEELKDEDGNVITESDGGINLYEIIHNMLEANQDVPFSYDYETGKTITFNTLDVYVFYRETEAPVLDEVTGEELKDEEGNPIMETYTEFSCVFVCDTDVSESVIYAGFNDVFVAGLGYYVVTGNILQACIVWKNAQ